MVAHFLSMGEVRSSLPPSSLCKVFLLQLSLN